MYVTLERMVLDRGNFISKNYYLRELTEEFTPSPFPSWAIEVVGHLWLP